MTSNNLVETCIKDKLFCAYTVNFWTVTLPFENFIYLFIFFKCKIEYKKIKKNAIQVFQNFGSVGKRQTIIFFRPHLTAGLPAAYPFFPEIPSGCAKLSHSCMMSMCFIICHARDKITQVIAFTYSFIHFINNAW